MHTYGYTLIYTYIHVRMYVYTIIDVYVHVHTGEHT